ncbi:MAG: hypothetical protein ACAH95_08675 [Fimbriimonas sp.]
MKAVLAAILTLASGFAGAQDPKRVAAIWDAANERISKQVDIWFEDGEFPMTIQLLRVQVDLYPDDYDVATNLGWMLENIEEWELAREAYASYRKANPREVDAALPEAEFMFRRKKYEEVLRLLGKVNDKAHPNAFRILAHSYERLNRLSESQKVWKRYISLAPKDLTAVKNLERVEKKLAAQKGALSIRR